MMCSLSRLTAPELFATSARWAIAYRGLYPHTELHQDGARDCPNTWAACARPERTRQSAAPYRNRSKSWSKRALMPAFLGRPLEIAGNRHDRRAAARSADES